MATPNLIAPPPYVGGTVTVPAASAKSLLDLIRQYLHPSCPGSCAELCLSTSATVMVGSVSPIAGAVSATNFAYSLTATGPPRVYRPALPGESVPLGDLQVFSTAGGPLSVEVIT